MDFINSVLSFYDNNQRVLPWRESRNPYHIWISEIMLQQTRVETVIPYYNRFISVLPDIRSLSEAKEETLYKLWEGLGYYSRVRNLKKAAIQVMNEFQGALPKTRKDLETLSGIGPYTSGAISSIAFEQRNAAVDGNVLRIFARLYEMKDFIKDKEVKKEIKQKVESVLPLKRIGDFNQGLMEIGATVCIPNGTPKCAICPLKDFCKAYENKTYNDIPVKQKRKKTPIHNKTVLLLEYDNSFAIEKRPDSGLLRSMYQFPLLDNHLSTEEIECLFKDSFETITKLPKSIHKFTHLQWDMVGYHITLKNKITYQFMTKEHITNTISIPSAFKVYKNIILSK